MRRYSISALRAWLIIGLLAVGLNQSVPKQADKSQPNQNSGRHVPSQPANPATENRPPLGGPGPQKEDNRTKSEAKPTSWFEKLMSPVKSNWPLVAVAIWGILVARRTLKAIARQADIMERQTRAIRRQALSMRRQTTIFRKSVEVAEKNVEAAQLGAEAAKEGAEATKRSIEMLVSKERARLRIDLKALNLSTKQFSGFSVYTVDFTVNIYGATAAYIVESGCVAYALPLNAIDCEEPGSAVISPLHLFPSVIAPNSPPLEQFAFLFLDHEASLLPEIRENSFFVGVRGFIKYRDVFDQDRETRFRYVWKYDSMYGLGGDFGHWEKCGASTDNYET